MLIATYLVYLYFRIEEMSPRISQNQLLCLFKKYPTRDYELIFD
jgi:hypothetical protein